MSLAANPCKAWGSDRCSVGMVTRRRAKMIGDHGRPRRWSSKPALARITYPAAPPAYGAEAELSGTAHLSLAREQLHAAYSDHTALR